ncbi:MAG: DUF1801 domain-containing protein [Flavobacterium sp.]|nr:MAG: DUF1801 domain-containing protein [Flavobacterium sp.]
MQSQAATPQEYIDSLPDDRKQAVSAIRREILDNLPEGFSEKMSYGMLGYVVPHSIFPDGYHCDPKLPLPFLNLASQRNFIALYHMGLYADKKLLDWFLAEYPKHSKRKLDMGKSCLRFKRLDDIPLKLIGELVSKMTVADWIAIYSTMLRK